MSGAIAGRREQGSTRAGAGRVEERLKVLVVEQHAEVLRGLTEIVAGQPIALVTCANTAEALLALGRTEPDVVLLGPVRGMLPTADFINVVRSDDPDLPILAGAGRDSTRFAADAAANGAAAVIPRPYRGAELLSLLRSLSPRADRLELRPLPIDLGRLRLDGAVPRIWIDGEQVSLPPVEFTLLRQLAQREGQVVSRADLIDAVWGDGQQANSNTLSVHIMRLRKRLNRDEPEEWIQSVRGLGYQLSVPPLAGHTGAVPRQR